MSEQSLKYLPAVQGVGESSPFKSLFQDFEDWSFGQTTTPSSGTMMVNIYSTADPTPFHDAQLQLNRLRARNAALKKEISYFLSGTTTHFPEWLSQVSLVDALNNGATMGASAIVEADESEFPEHGISMVKFPTRLIFEQELQLQLSEAPRWKPRIVIDDSLR